ncbi:MAG: hypothetical protein JW910_09425 [Anaerolineae bacterium]|nr:hypothetical protein [Anaerolineae bacterium]
MSLPFELTTLPANALDIIRYLGGLDGYAAFDVEIIEALRLSERGFGKAIRRLVTQEYVEMQIDGTYVLTQRGLDAAETLEAHDAEAMHEAFDDAAIEAADLPEYSVPRRLLVVYPKALPVAGTAHLFVRVAAPPVDGERAGGELLCRLSGDLTCAPEQLSLTVPADAASSAVRFAVTAPAAGDLALTLDVFQVAQLDLLEAGTITLTLTAAGAGADTFLAEAFEVILLAGA